eukprot:2635472-Rhodomonas_salina.1
MTITAASFFELWNIHRVAVVRTSRKNTKRQSVCAGQPEEGMQVAVSSIQLQPNIRCDVIICSTPTTVQFGRRMQPAKRIYEKRLQKMV